MITEKNFHLTEQYQALIDLMAELDKEPEEKEVLMNEVTQNSYIPIDILEGMLDRFTLGQYSFKNFKYTYTATKVLGSIELEFQHPITGNWLTRTGAAAILVDKKVIQKGKDSTVTLDVELAQPAILSLCSVSAIRKVGRCFGRSLNRDIVDLATDNTTGNSADLQLAINELNSMSTIQEINSSKESLIEKYTPILQQKELARLSDIITKRVIELLKPQNH